MIVSKYAMNFEYQLDMLRDEDEDIIVDHIIGVCTLCGYYGEQSVITLDIEDESVSICFECISEAVFY